MKKASFIILVGLFRLYAQDSLYTIESMLEKALSNNTTLSRADYDIKSAALQRSISATLPDPLFMTEFRGLPVDAQNLNETREWMFMLQQSFPFPGKLATSARLAETQESIQQHKRDETELNIRAAVKTVYYRLALVQRALELNKEQQHRTEKILQLADTAYRTGKVPLSKVYRIKTEIAELEIVRVDLQQKKQTLVSELNTLLNRPLYKPLGASLPDLLPLPPLHPDSLLQPDHPAIIAAQSRIRLNKTGEKMARLQQHPDISVMGGYMAMNGMTDAWMGRISISLPFVPWSVRRNSARINTTRLETEKAQIELTELENNLKFETQKYYNSLNALYRQINLTEQTVIPAYEKILDLSTSEFIAGQTDLAVLLDQTNDLIQQKLTLAEKKSRYLVTLAQLERVYQIRGE